MKKIKKAQTGTVASSDSTDYYRKRRKAWSATLDKFYDDTKSTGYFNKKVAGDIVKDMEKEGDNEVRQYRKGKPGYDAMGFPVKKKKMGGKVKKAQSGSKLVPKNLDDYDLRPIMETIKRSKSKPVAPVKSKGIPRPSAGTISAKAKCGAKVSKKKK